MEKGSKQIPVTSPKPHRRDRERLILLALVDLYLKSGKPIGSQTLQEHGFQSLSSATIRNYLAKLEGNGLLEQPHTSGGRVPTAEGLKVYAEQGADYVLSKKELDTLKEKLQIETREVGRYLEQVSEYLSDLTGCALFIAMPRFDQDFVTDVKLVEVDPSRCLAVILTDFGQIHTEVLHISKKLSAHALKRLEAYFHYKITGLDEPKLESDEKTIASDFYKEVMVRYVVHTASFSHADLYKTGFSKLLQYPEFNVSASLASSLALFENSETMEALLAKCKDDLTYWIDEDEAPACSCIAVPYSVQNRRVGALALLGPTRLPYPKLFATFRAASHLISEALTNSLYKFKITYRQPGENLLIEDQKTP